MVRINNKEYPDYGTFNLHSRLTVKQMVHPIAKGFLEKHVGKHKKIAIIEDVNKPKIVHIKLAREQQYNVLDLKPEGE